MIKDYGKIVKNIRNYTKDYILNSNLKSMVLGVSGGIDSAIVAALMYPLAKDLNIDLIGITLPANSNKSEEITRSFMVMESFCTKSVEIPIQNIVDTIVDDGILETIFKLDENIDTIDKDSMNLILGNSAARARMSVLFGVANYFNGMVLSTDNLSEYMVGFWTLHGDVGNFGPIQNLWKDEIYELAKWVKDNELTTNHKKWLALNACTKAKPTDGLGISESDEDQLGTNWKQASIILKNYTTIQKTILAQIKLNRATNAKEKELAEDRIKSLIELENMLEDHPVVIRHKKTHFKRNDPHNIPRDILIS